ncbi:DUF5957 family protein [Piscibacillus halophilus]|uniref:Uncharacterized protein n=2 Tax=Piscibacillus halophilus TaxID=571933 RepID=A0A1H9KUW1_9BACI|nr:DUF5957 family protein [Piscibacillus halophilus]SER02982.1 hypothetical protein SAMN05216362_14112 [Piscibacillus halophilus]
MNIFIAILIGLIGGFIIGIALSSFIGIIGMMLFNEPLGVKYLPYYTAFLCAIILPIWGYKSRT